MRFVGEQKGNLYVYLEPTEADYDGLNPFASVEKYEAALNRVAGRFSDPWPCRVYDVSEQQAKLAELFGLGAWIDDKQLADDGGLRNYPDYRRGWFQS